MINENIFIFVNAKIIKSSKFIKPEKKIFIPFTKFIFAKCVNFKKIIF